MRCRSAGLTAGILSGAAAMLLAAAPGAAQAPQCPDSGAATRTIAPGHYVYPEAVAELGGGELVLGWPAFRLAQDSQTKWFVADTALAGMLASEGRVQGVPWPIAGWMAEAPRASPVSDTVARVFFVKSKMRAMGVVRSDSVEVWSGLYSRAGWRALRRIGTFAREANFERQIASDLVADRGDLVFAFASGAFDGRRTSIILVRQGADSARIERLDLGFKTATYADLAIHRGELWLVVTASGVERRSESAYSEGESIWTSRLTSSGWSQAVREEDGQHRQLLEPRLFSSDAGLFLAWIENQGGGESLRWRRVSPGRAPLSGSFPSVGRLVKGETPFADYFIMATDSTSARLIAFGPTGAEVRAILPTVNGISPTIAGTRDKPVAIRVRFGTLEGELPVTLVAHDIRCAFLPPAQTPR